MLINIIWVASAVYLLYRGCFRARSVTKNIDHSDSESDEDLIYTPYLTFNNVVVYEYDNQRFVVFPDNTVVINDAYYTADIDEAEKSILRSKLSYSLESYIIQFYEWNEELFEELHIMSPYALHQKIGTVYNLSDILVQIAETFNARIKVFGCDSDTIDEEKVLRIIEVKNPSCAMYAEQLLHE